MITIIKYFPYCGTLLEFPNAKFCPEFGYALAEHMEKETIPILETSEANEVGDAVRLMDVNELANRLEEIVESIFETKGYETERRQRVLHLTCT